MFDAIIVGGGPAGIQAALILGRCLRSLAIGDSGSPRNKFSKALHAFLTRDDIPPEEFLEFAHRNLRKYETVRFLRKEAVTAKQIPDGFIVTLKSGETLLGRTVLIATGVIDELPEIPGFLDYYGKNIYNCPYCDVWEHSGEPLAV